VYTCALFSPSLCVSIEQHMAQQQLKIIDVRAGFCTLLFVCCSVFNVSPHLFVLEILNKNSQWFISLNFNLLGFLHYIYMF
jgi:hypothetical protein